ncbi:UvrD-helicase domain-containing protein [Halorhodospira halochloris]|uniref:UvrD-helicase domain-containing protein n=1 Tax=Halorhodospira halochloris TaxID=1052 RepID=UPI001EE97A91|nr:UvrD-helicase domain-containing protein [Halorhodospira halochloris]MCG5547757.1 UvrD-helicase domain-containing protein [Halorhodospira halochloris]
MKVLIYNELEPEYIDGFDKVYNALQSGNFAQADVRKIGDNLYRARLNRSDRLLFTLRKAAGEKCCLILEHIPNHNYDKSRFLRGGAVIDEDKIPPVKSPAETSPESSEHLNPNKDRFNLLDKVITFDDQQEDIYYLQPPIIMIGSAGSGKTALAIEKLKEMQGAILYISQSPFLVEHSRNLYYSHGYYNPNQTPKFLSYKEFIESIRVPEGTELSAEEFCDWFYRQPESKDLKSPHKVFEEIRGVIAGQAYSSPYLDRTSYKGLGVRQSIFNHSVRDKVYDVFEKYLNYLKKEGRYDPIILSHQYLPKINKQYDFVVVDELQDLTNIQILLILKSLNQPHNFLFCGDANQIVHPNHFSWANIKSLIRNLQYPINSGRLVNVLHNNYRNSSNITEIANRVLKIKQKRFGSIDKESNVFVTNAKKDSGKIQLLEDTTPVRQALNELTGLSANVAVIVLHPSQKSDAREKFETPLIFSIQEAKGLEYDSIIFYNIISDEAEIYETIAGGIDKQDLDSDNIGFARSRDKTDKSIETYKFYINALYVGITRAVKNIYWVECDQNHKFLHLLGLVERLDNKVAGKKERSTLKKWRSEAKRLELQGQEEQANEIRHKILQHNQAPWHTINREEFESLRDQVFNRGINKYRLELFEYSLLHCHLPTLCALSRERFGPATQNEIDAVRQVHRNHFMGYNQRNYLSIIKQTDKFGVDHPTRYNLTPLMIAARMGNYQLLEDLINLGADPAVVADNGFNPVHFALEQAYLDTDFAAHKLTPVYQLLAPLNLSLQADSKLLMLDRQQMEFFLFYWLSMLFYRGLGPLVGSGENGFTADWISSTLAHLPNDILPESCKQPSFILDVLYANEFRRSSDNSLRLFRRTTGNSFVINPGVQVRSGKGWTPYYHLFQPHDLDPGVTPERIYQEKISNNKKIREPIDAKQLYEIHMQRDRNVGIFRNWLIEQTRTWTM